ncbi:hypothetical protein V8C42DRAFT_345280 [Trichoderma barbatum]
MREFLRADIEQVGRITSWDVLQKELFDTVGAGTSKGIPYEISLLEPTLGHYHHFTHIFESQLAPGLQANFFWGIIGILLQLTAQDPQALPKIPRMLKSLGYKVQLVQFFTTAVKSMRGEEDEIQHYKRARHDIATNRRTHGRGFNQVSLMQLPTKIYPSFFNRESTFEKIDQVLGRDGSTTTFRSIVLFGLGTIGKSSIAARYIER